MPYCTCEPSTEKLLSCYKVFHRCWSICFAFIFFRVLTFIHYIGVDFTFGFLDFVRYNEDFVTSRFVISRFSFIHFTVRLAGLKNIIRYTEDFVT